MKNWMKCLVLMLVLTAVIGAAVAPTQAARAVATRFGVMEDEDTVATQFGVMEDEDTVATQFGVMEDEDTVATKFGLLEDDA